MALSFQNGLRVSAWCLGAWQEDLSRDDWILVVKLKKLFDIQ